MEEFSALSQWTTHQRQKADAAQEVLRALVQCGEPVVAYISPTDRGIAAMDLIARADVGIDVALVVPGSALLGAAALRETLEAHYNFAVTLVTGDMATEIAVGSSGEEHPLFKGWSEAEIVAYGAAHGTPRLGSQAELCARAHLAVA